MSTKFLTALLKVIAILSLVLAGFSASVAPAGAARAEAIVGTGLILPSAPAITPTLSSQIHPSGFKRTFSKDPSQVILNPNAAASSIDISFSGNVVAPISGKITIPADCPAEKGYVHHQIVFIQGSNGFAVGLTHVTLNSTLSPGKSVTQGQVIGKTAWPIPTSASTSLGCGWGTGPHIHFTLMKWAKNNLGLNGANFTEQAIGNTYLGQWIVKDGWLDGPRNDVSKGGKIEDIIKITSVHSGKIIEGRDTGIVRTMFFVAGNLKQTWNLIDAGGGYVYFKNRQYGNCMTIEGAGLADGAKTILSACGDLNSQRFKKVAAATGNGFLAKHSGKALDIPTDWSVPGSGKGDGIQLQQWQAFLGANQQWILAKP